MKLWQAVTVSLLSALISGFASGWISSEKTVAALQVEVQWIKESLRANSERIAALERR